MPRRRARPARGASSSPSPSRLERLIDCLPDVVFSVRLSPRPRLEHINHAVLPASGYSPEEWYADPTLALRMIHPSDKRKLLEIARSRRVPPQPLLLRWTRRDGAPLRTEVTLAAVYGRRGAIAAIQGVARNVTALAADPPPARAADRSLREVVEQIPVGVARIGVDGRLLLVNRRLCEMTRYLADELLARRFRDIVHADDAERAAAVLQQLRAGDVPEATSEQRLACKDGSDLWVKLTACRLRNTGETQMVAVMQAIDAPAGRENEQRRLTYCGIDVDTDRLEVSWNGRRVPVTLKEVLLLRYLIRHRGEMLARDRLLKDVWGYEHAGRSRTLDVHVCRLRRKLPPLADSLATIGHFGYTLSQGVVGGQAAGAGV
jgi:PAS domain S-box-containing protein